MQAVHYCTVNAPAMVVCTSAYSPRAQTPRCLCRELTETLKRMNKGAQKVSDITGTSGESLIFRGGVMFCLKDVQRAAMPSTVGEFKGKIKDYVQAGQNFVSTIYHNSVVISAFPPLSRLFFKALRTVCSQRLACMSILPVSRDCLGSRLHMRTHTTKPSLPMHAGLC
jgi:hypothetical protein